MSVAPQTLIFALRALLDVAEADGWSTPQILDLLRRIGAPVVIVETAPMTSEQEAFYRQTCGGRPIFEMVDAQDPDPLRAPPREAQNATAVIAEVLDRRARLARDEVRALTPARVEK